LEGEVAPEWRRHILLFSSSAADGAVRAAPHEDINLITMLIGSTEMGLQVSLPCFAPYLLFAFLSCR
jgi:isopenicillin N synthase-like dioxygenase